MRLLTSDAMRRWHRATDPPGAHEERLRMLAAASDLKDPTVLGGAGERGRLTDASRGAGERHAWDISDEDPISLDLYEKRALLRALEACDGDRLSAARLLRVGKRTLERKLRRYGIGE